MKRLVISIVLVLTARGLMGQTAPHTNLGIVSDWTHRHVLFPDSNDYAAVAETRRDPRWVHNWFLRHPEAWWPQRHRPARNSQRDWNLSLVALPSTYGFEPVFNFTFGIGGQAGYGALNATDIGNGEFLATAGSLTVTGVPEVGSYPLLPGGPTELDSPSGRFLFDDILYPSVDPPVDTGGLLFLGAGLEINIWGNAANSYEFDDWNGTAYTNDTTGTGFTLTEAPGGGQTFPAKYAFDVTAAPSCANDFVVMGVPCHPSIGWSGEHCWREQPL